MNPRKGGEYDQKWQANHKATRIVKGDEEHSVGVKTPAIHGVDGLDPLIHAGTVGLLDSRYAAASNACGLPTCLCSALWGLSSSLPLEV